MGHTSGYLAQHIAEKHGKCGRDQRGVFWEHNGTRYFFTDENARRWFAKACVNGTLESLHEHSQPLWSEFYLCDYHADSEGWDECSHHQQEWCEIDRVRKENVKNHENTLDSDIRVLKL